MRELKTVAITRSEKLELLSNFSGDLCRHDCYALHLHSTVFIKILKLLLILERTKAAIFLT